MVFFNTLSFKDIYNAGNVISNFYIFFCFYFKHYCFIYFINLFYCARAIFKINPAAVAYLSARFSVNGQVTLISLGKDQGMSVAEIGEWVGNFYKQGWTEGPREPSAAVVAFYRNQKVFPTGEMEVVGVSGDAVTVRFNRPHLLVFGDDMVHYGVTVDEYEEVMKIAQDIIGDWIGLDLDQRIDGNWWYITFKKK